MKKWLTSTSIIAVAIIAVFLLSSTWLYSLPFMPESWRNNFRLNANILPASDDSRSLYVAINPGFRAEFGDRENPTSAFLRFEKTKTTDIEADKKENADVSENLLDSLALVQITKDYQPGIEWQLFSVSIDADQLLGGTELAEGEEIQAIARELLGEQITDEVEDDLAVVAREREEITTETVVTRYQGYDQVANMAVAEDVDLKYTVVPGKGIRSQIWIGDRQNFDTACLKLLSLTGSEAGCNLPSNKFSFLLQLDNGQRLEHSPLAIDESTNGTYYIVDEKGKFLFRMGNPILTDSSGNKSQAVSMEVRPGLVGGEEIANYYIVTLTANLSWLIDHERKFPVNIETGFYIDGKELFGGEEIIENSISQEAETTEQNENIIIDTEASESAVP